MSNPLPFEWKDGVLHIYGDGKVTPPQVCRSDRQPGPEITAAVVRVGEGGRGFIVEGKDEERYVITAAHCLPELPPAHPNAYPEERHYGRFLGKLGTEPSIAVECLFADPVADLAVLGKPHEDLPDHEAYEALVSKVTPLQVGAVEDPVQAWLLSLDGKWFRCDVAGQRYLWLNEIEQKIESGMSGSPIVVDGKAVGVVCTSEASGAIGGPEPGLAKCLPAWLATELIKL